MTARKYIKQMCKSREDIDNLPPIFFNTLINDKDAHGRPELTDVMDILIHTANNGFQLNGGARAINPLLPDRVVKMFSDFIANSRQAQANSILALAFVGSNLPIPDNVVQTICRKPQDAYQFAAAMMNRRQGWPPEQIINAFAPSAEAAFRFISGLPMQKDGSVAYVPPVLLKSVANSGYASRVIDFYKKNKSPIPPELQS